MIIYSGEQASPVKLKAPHDPDDTIDYSIYWAPPVWSSQTVAQEGSIVCPQTDNGFYALCTSGGITGLNDPVWSTIKNAKVTDGDVEWTMKPWDFELKYGEVIAASTWTVDPEHDQDVDGATLGTVTYADTFNDYMTTVWVVDVDDGVETFKLTNQITTDNTPPRIISASMIVKVKDR